MSPLNEQHFYQNYPLIFRPCRGRQTGAAPYWGLSVRDGWFDLIDTLCDEHETQYQAQKIALA